MGKDLIVKYSGTPKEPTKDKESTKWSRFLSWLLPWGKDKLLKLDNYADSELALKSATAEKTSAEALKAEEEAKKTHVETMSKYFELEKSNFEWLKELDPENKDEEIQEVKKELLQKIKMLRLNYGGRILDISKNKSGFPITLISDEESIDEEKS
ncbi:MAG: hypothetical protein AAGA66_19460 [Bacteroidota bacterium]